MAPPPRRQPPVARPPAVAGALADRPAPPPPRGLIGAAVPRVVHRRAAPSARLAERVAHFWFVRWDLRGEPARQVETLPHPTVHVVVEGARVEVAGVQTRRFVRRLEGAGWVFGVKLRPGSLRPTYDGPLHRLRDRVVPAAEVLGEAATLLQRRIAAEMEALSVATPDQGGGERATDALDAVLAPCVAHAEAILTALADELPAEGRRARDLVERLERDRELLRVEQVAALAGLDVRGLQRLFRAWVGATPKWVLGRYRMHEALERLRAGDAESLAALSVALGYFDQAHFARDFKAVIGRTPGALASPARPLR